MKTYKDIYMFPLKCTGYSDRVYDLKGNFVFQFEPQFVEGDFDPKYIELRDKIMTVLNSNERVDTGDKFYHESGQICKTGTRIPLITIRGWGNLTGIGANNLSHEEAANIQDTFAEFIVEKLNN